MENSSEKKSMIDQLPSRTAFWAGVTLTAGVMFALGFIVLLVMMVSGADFGKSAKKTTTTTAAANTNTNTAPTPAAPSGTVDPESIDWVRGDGDITVVEYSDIDCPFCQRFHGTMQQVMTDYDGKVKWGYKHFPLTSLHPNAQSKALAAECAGKQDGDKFWDYLDGLFENTSTDTDEIDTEATTLGLDPKKINDCMDSGEFDDKIASESSEAQSFGGQGTPYSLIIDKDGTILDSIPGALPVDQVKTLLDKYVK